MAKHQDLTAEDIFELVGSYMNDEHVAFVEKAYEAAKRAHEGQFRSSGEPYILHPVQVAGILAELQMDPSTVAAGFLHDVVEDTEICREDIVKSFGEEVAMLVDGVTKLEKLKFKSNEEKQAENHRKMFIAMAQDIRVILIKLADRLHNMRTLKYVKEEKQRRISAETLEIFAPLAHRLGISAIKWELEDIALRYLNPQQYYRIVNLMKQKRVERENYLKNVMEQIHSEIGTMDIHAELSGRPKHLYSIYRKMVLQKKEFNEIYDLLAVRIVVKSIKDCYAVLGIIHTLWKPMPGRFKDYIAMPKQNLYQSLHTTVVGPAGDPLEVQIRTEEMHKIAEFGVAAHWAYKEGITADHPDTIDSKLTWFREILEMQNESSNAEEFMESLKFDLFSDMVYVFTPEGDVIELPKGSVPIDFAYRVHSEVGNRTIGAKVNGKMVPLETELFTGDIVEVLTSKQSFGPSRDWLKIANTSQARNKIRQYFKKQLREENIYRGKELLEKEVKQQEYVLREVVTPESLRRVIDKYSFTSEEDMYAAIGSGGITAQQVVNRMTDKIRKEREQKDAIDKIVSEIKTQPPQPMTESGVVVKGLENLLIRLSKCCNPVPGDEIVGFITKGRGVSVHRVDCPNIHADGEQGDRLIDVSWAVSGTESVKKEFQVDIEITGYDRQGLLNEVMMTVVDTKTSIVAVSGKADRVKIAHISMSIKITDLQHLQRIVDKIKQVRDIYSVQRIIN
ncbi:bifunctional (p)ppGpp synthetase/guanosine-3',5'-bis(diphosphate) 3'-pyrophosphohydrolase [Sporosarcina sp. BI001-red]|uniref:RelA/SpoT family protein n=1 Tax=Sporosarcina sp. BI001-red TaxID=2282866 RepID=UPI000E26BBBE|nr:bifunctional (p)ppGpp synthetase/guanosine-3',5'-bis(diphosphate) 3'-pyrophosphohydrolase [Sporosarcina sp. BI001-red]REB07204.1 bifunctional (p)ppGpp synthetase/guanosine-3',5'-bis(diphosphate) 3'-pyrophosphohydrolase [Sporosarcina sp. BI001-red]